jgi:hypothetical protein
MDTAVQHLLHRASERGGGMGVAVKVGAAVGLCYVAVSQKDRLLRALLFSLQVSLR